MECEVKMKFELVGFFPLTDKNRGKAKKSTLGSIHIYLIDCQIDIRGIMVSKKGKSLFFHIPHFYGLDGETGEPIRYPFFRFTKEKDHQDLLDFLHKDVKPAIFKHLNARC